MLTVGVGRINTAELAEQILEAYFEMEAASDVFTYENQVG